MSLIIAILLATTFAIKRHLGLTHWSWYWVVSPIWVWLAFVAPPLGAVFGALLGIWLSGYMALSIQNNQPEK